MYELLYENHPRFAEDNIFEELDLDIETFHSDRENPALIQQIEDEAATARSIGVRATPTYIINGELYTGAYPIATYREIVERLLEEE